jgi:hypothetical protein
VNKPKLHRPVVLDPEPPDGVDVFYMNAKGQACKPSDAVAFTWAGCDRWHKIDKPEEKR